VGLIDEWEAKIPHKKVGPEAEGEILKRDGRMDFLLGNALHFVTLAMGLYALLFADDFTKRFIEGQRHLLGRDPGLNPRAYAWFVRFCGLVFIAGAALRIFGKI